MNEKATQGGDAAGFLQQVGSPLRFRLFMMRRLPAALFSGVQLERASPERSEVSVPYRWSTQNPFRSTYFACLAMAAEMSTGVLAMAHLYRRRPAVSMLVTGLEGRFHKKATGKTVFTCGEGAALHDAIEAAITTGAPQTVRALSTGRNSAGETVAEFWITWSFKAKN